MVNFLGVRELLRITIDLEFQSSDVPWPFQEIKGSMKSIVHLRASKNGVAGAFIAAVGILIEIRVRENTK